MTLNCSQELVEMIIEFMSVSIKEGLTNDFNNVNNFYQSGQEDTLFQ